MNSNKQMIKVPFKSDVSEQDKLYLFSELGLDAQKNKLKANIKAKEITSIMEGAEYKEVSLDDVTELFEFKRLNKAVSKYNLKQFFTHFFGYWAIATFGLYVFVDILLCKAMLLDLNPQSIGGFIGAGIIGLFISGFSLIPLSIVNIPFENEWNKTFLELKLVVEDIKKTEIDIPWAAALKLKEAKEKNIFDRFVIAYPSIITKQLIPKSDDPAILGVKTIKGVDHYYMVVYYDIEKDKQDILNKI